MNDESGANSAAVADAGAQAGGLSAGQLLRQAREAARYDIAVLAATLKVPVEKLQALEADRIDLLPDATFARGLASAMCRSLGVNPALVLERMPRSGHKLANDDEAINAPFREPTAGVGSLVGAAMSRQAVWIGVALLLGAVALALLPSIPGRFGGGDAQAPAASASSVVASGSVVTPVAVASAAEGASASSPAEGASAAPTGIAAASAALPAGPAVVAVPVTPAVASAPSVAPVAAASDAPAATGEGLIAFTARGETWVSVRDAKGASLLNRGLAAGETVALTGDAPLSVTVGRADLTEVKVRGKAFEMPTRGGVVARFKVE